MKKNRIKSWLCFILSAATVLPVFGLWGLISFAEDEIYLTALDYSTVNTIAGELSFDSNITIGEESFEHGIYIHPTGAGDAGAASIVYILDGSYSRFSTWVGKNAAGNGWGNNPMQFEIYVDGNLMAKSEILQYPDKEKLEIALPENAGELKLVAKATGDSHFACGATFAEPILTCSSSGGSFAPTSEKSITALDYEEAYTLYGVTNPLTTTREGELRIDNNITIGKEPFEKGIYLHPASAGGSAYITYNIENLIVKSFKTYVGKDKNGGSWDNQKVRFEIYIDGTLMAKSKNLSYPEKEELSFEVPAGAKELKLVAIAIENNTATGCCFGNPMIVVESKPGELIISNKPLAEMPNPEGPYTFKGWAYADSVELYCDGQKVGEATPNSQGNFSITVNFEGKENRTLQFQSIVDGNIMSTESFIYMMNDDITYASALKVESWTGLQAPKVYTVNAAMSIGGSGRLRTAYGFQNHPTNGKENDCGAADININIEGLGYRYFHTTVGKEDSVLQGGTGVEFIVLADGVVLARSGNLNSYEISDMSCDIPEDAKILTLRVTNYDGNYEYGTSDWCNPILARDRSVFLSHTVPVYEETAEEISLDLSEGIAFHFRTEESMKAVLLPTLDTVKGLVSVKLYKFMGSYFATTKRTPVEQTILSESEFDKVFVFSDTLDSGEYLLVIAGAGIVPGYKSESGVIYRGQEILEYTPKIAFSFVNQSTASYFGRVEGVVGDGDAAATVPSEEEKQAAKAVYDSYLAENLKNFPITVTIGKKKYNGFGDNAFRLLSQTVEQNDRYGEQTESVIEYTPEDPAYAKILFTVTSVFYSDYAAYDWVIYFSNKDSEKNTEVISKLNSQVEFIGSDPYVYGYSGDPSGFTPLNFKVTDTARIIAPLDGRSTNDAFPYWNMEYGDGGALIAVGWAGQWQASFQKSGKGNDTKTTFINGQQTFHSYLKPDETARTPITAVVQYDGRDTDRATNLWRRFMIDCNMPRTEEENQEEQIVSPMILGTTHEYFNEMTGTNEQEQLEALRHFLENGADLDIWWMDAGWYYGANGKTNIGSNWWDTGSWLMDTQRFPTSLASIAEFANEQGVGTMLWFEPERVGNKSYLKRDGSTLNPDWVFSSGLVDYSNEECVDWLIERITSILRTINASVYREDFNMGPLSTWSAVNSSDPERAGMTENLHIQGHFRLWQAIKDAFPNIIIDSCASGGRRNDLESMRYAVPLHRTDQGYGDSSLQQCYTYAMSAWIPYFGSKADSDVPDESVYRTKYSDKYALRRALVPAMEYNYSPYDPIDWYKVAKAGAEQRNVSKYYYADYYRLTDYERSESAWMAWEYYIPAEGHGYANIWRRSKAEPTQRIFLKGLDSDALYDVWFEDRNCHAQYTGYVLMYTGIEVTLPSLRSSDLMYFSIVGNSYAPYTERPLTVQVTEPSISTYGGQLGKALNPTTLSGVSYYSLALRFNMSIRDTVLSTPIGTGEGYIEKGVQNDYAELISVNGIRLSELLKNDPDAVLMDYDVYNNMITLYIKQDNAAGFKKGVENRIQIDPNFRTFEGVALDGQTTYTLSANAEKWEEEAVSVTGVLLSESELSLAVGQSHGLTATVLPGNAENRTVAFTSSDESVATVDPNGKVTAVSAGSAVITVTTADGEFTAECTVTVSEGSVPQPATGERMWKHLLVTTLLALACIPAIGITVTRKRKKKR